MRPTISVITPSYNQGAFIERTIQSVLAQKIPGLEYTVVDGQSSDETVSILRQYSAQLHWVSEKDNGQADAVNKGIRSTSGEIIGWLNSDDIYYPGAIGKVIAYFKKHPDAAVIYGNANHIDADDNVLEPYPTESWNLPRLHDICFLCQPAVFFRRRVIEVHGALNSQLQYCMDYEFWLRLGQKGVRFDYLPDLLAGSRLHPATKTLGSRVQAHREINDMLRQRAGRVPHRWLYNYAHAVLDDKGVSRARKLRFAVGLCTHSNLASLRWNRRLSSEMLKTTAGWMWQSAFLGRKGGVCR